MPLVNCLTDELGGAQARTSVETMSRGSMPYTRTGKTHVLVPWCCGAVLSVIAIWMTAEPGFATVTISSAQTKNMSCSNGVCVPTAADAVLNVSDLETMLASGNATVTTTGAGSVQASDIDVSAGISWVSSGVLSLIAWRSLEIKKPIAVNGASGLSVATNSGGAGGMFYFGPKGNVTFLDLASSLTINGTAYTFVNSVASLASAVSSNPGGDYALANNYDASHDGTYARSPVSTELSGVFEGLGNNISNLSINDPVSGDYVGLFSEIGSGNQPGGMVENIALRNIGIGGNGLAVGGLVGLNIGTINGSFAGGSVTSNLQQGSEIGLLVGASGGSIARSAATGTVKSSWPESGGGLVGGNHSGFITQSYANCNVLAGASSGLGGLVGTNVGTITQSYAMGKVSGGDRSDVGGLMGESGEASTIAQAYSTTAVKLDRDTGGHKGGLIGVDGPPAGNNSFAYWDTTNSKITSPSHGAGNIKNDPGITGLTTTQLQSGLPAGFDPAIWAENPKINNGYPYLIANPPRKK